MFASAGCNLFTQTPEICNWVKEVEPDKEITVGGYAYLDGALHVKVALAMDAVMQGVCEARKKPVTLAFLCTPTDVHMIPQVCTLLHLLLTFQAAADAARANLKSMPFWQKLLFNFGLKKNVMDPIKSDAGLTINLVDGLVVDQGPNYGLAKRMQHWRAIVRLYLKLRLITTGCSHKRIWSVHQHRSFHFHCLRSSQRTICCCLPRNASL